MTFGSALSTTRILTPRWKINTSSFANQIYSTPGDSCSYDLDDLSHRSTWTHHLATPLSLQINTLRSQPRRDCLYRWSITRHPPLGCKATLSLHLKKHHCHRGMPSIIWQGCLQASHFPQQLCGAANRSDSIITALVLEHDCAACGLRSGSITLPIRY